MFLRSILPANTTLQTISGHIIHYNREKNYGFVKTADNESYFFRYNKREQAWLKKNGAQNAMHTFTAGDEVEFQLKPSAKHTEQWEAYNLICKNNSRESSLLQQASENKILSGTLIKKADKFFIKHLQAEIFIPVSVSPWETSLEITYDSCMNQTVQFTLNPSVNFNHLKAFLVHRKYSSLYTTLQEIKNAGQPIPAVITSKNYRGYAAKAFDRTVSCFAAMPKQLNEEQRNHFFRFKKEDSVTVKIKTIPLSSKQLSITFVV